MKGIVHIPFNKASENAPGLMSAEDKKKSDGIAEGATKTAKGKTNGNISINGVETTVYEHPASTAGAKTAGLYKITTDANGHVTGAEPVAKADIVDLGISASDTTYEDATPERHGLLSAEDKKKLDSVDDGANKYIHPTGEGFEHLPAGGKEGQCFGIRAGNQPFTAAWQSPEPP